ncbi:hypothetical protein WICPIJ_006583 [Wickerhamomyces pijperi]|uniref:Uncharacterized protein n=1 Tax=Wickerhamomyces pijperi TaxID=599730 RepID=A0A9P8TKR1_WICPI|nr:hypothetical protein WICPIJ_006583 [Wickerhamomyces pijperi]
MVLNLATTATGPKISSFKIANLELIWGGLSALVVGFVEWATDLDGFNLSLESSNDFVVDTFLDVDSGTGTTDFTTVEEDTGD